MPIALSNLEENPNNHTARFAGPFRGTTMTPESRNARALAAGQAAWDNASPAEDDGREDYIASQVNEMMEKGECDLVPFSNLANWPLSMDSFDIAGSEAIADADTSECELLKIVLACLNGEHDKAASLAKHFEEPLRSAASKLVEAAMDKETDDE